MTCKDCTAAAAGPHWGFRARCGGCSARMVARGPDFHRCRLAGQQDKTYRALLARVGVTHEDVCAAAKVERERSAA